MEDHERTFDGGGASAAVGEGETGEFLDEGDFPDGFTIGSEGDAAAVGGLKVNVACLGVDDG